MRNQVRIIAGKWRGRKIQFSKTGDIRPTHDRIRETLFNWLSPYIEGAVCLDLFAGSGVLGFEALSRGAQAVTFVDKSRENIVSLEANEAELQVNNVQVIHGECPKKMPILSMAPYDIIFLDPPYTKDLVVTASKWLVKCDYLKPGSLIYVEAEKDLSMDDLPSNWIQEKHSHTATIDYYLYRQAF